MWQSPCEVGWMKSLISIMNYDICQCHLQLSHYFQYTRITHTHAPWLLHDNLLPAYKDSKAWTSCVTKNTVAVIIHQDKANGHVTVGLMYFIGSSFGLLNALVNKNRY